MIDISQFHGQISQPIATRELEDLALRWGGNLPKQYQDLLRVSNGFLLDSGTKLYSSEELLERNTTFNVREYAPGYIAIGDDSGGMAFLLRLNGEDQRVYAVDHGSMDPADMEPVALSLESWLQSQSVPRPNAP